MQLKHASYNDIALQIQLRELSSTLRKHPTQAEYILWQYLKRRKLCGIKFRRQHPLYKYIIDFYAAELKLIVEIDGEIHNHKFNYDNARDMYFKKRGYIILRFNNSDVINNLNYVINSIQQNICSTSPPKQGGDRGEG